MFPPFSSEVHVSILVFMELIFAQSLFHKAQDLLRFSGYIENYHSFFIGNGYKIACVLIVIELFSLITCLVPSFNYVGQLTIVLLLLIYLSVISYAMISGKKKMECGCGDIPLIISKRIFLRNTFLVSLAILMIFLPTTHEVLSSIIGIAGGIVLWFFYQLCEQLIRNSDLHCQLIENTFSREGL